MSLRALLFDVDGTIADTECLGHRPAYNQAFKELGLPWRWGPKLYRRLLKQPGGRERVSHYLDSYSPELGERADDGRENPDNLVGDIHKAKSRHFSRLVKRGRVPLRPGIARLMREAAAAQIKLAIVSNASRATLEPVLEHSVGSELRGLLSLVISGEEVSAKKPAPDLYLRAAECLGVRPGECLAIEDSAMGLAAAVAAGIATVITVNQNTREEDFSGADLVVESLGEPGEPTAVITGPAVAGDCVALADLRDLLAQREDPAGGH